MLNYLSERFSNIFQRLKRKTRLTEEDLKKTLKEVKFLLLESDVNLLVIKHFLKEIETTVRARGLLDKLNSEQEVLNIFQAELSRILGKTFQELKFKQFPKNIMLVGLQGSGKTTTAAKMALFLKNKGVCRNPLLVSLDTHRAAAIEQLHLLAKQINVDFFLPTSQMLPEEIALEAKKFIQNNKYDLIIYDTSGRQTNSEELMNELQQLKQIIEPEKIIQVVDAMSGQEITKTVQDFQNLLNLSGFVITKLDSDARGGAILSITYLTNLPIFFMGEGEKLSNLSYFYPERFTNRILNLGDLASLVDRTKEKINKRKIENIGQRLVQGQFNLDDLMETLKQIGRLGKLTNVLKMLPGMAGKINNSQLDLGEKRIRVFKVLLSSMTPAERKNPKLLKNSSRKLRVIKGSGRSPQEFNALMNSFEITLKRIKELPQNNMLKFMQKQ